MNIHVACRLSNIATLDVLVVDENDEAPEFLQPDYSGGELYICNPFVAVHDKSSLISYISEVSSTAPPDTSILSVRAVDDDRSPEFSTVSGLNHAFQVGSM